MRKLLIQKNWLQTCKTALGFRDDRQRNACVVKCGTSNSPRMNLSRKSSAIFVACKQDFRSLRSGKEMVR